MKYLNSKIMSDLQGVFSSSVFCTYSWSLIIFFWDIPSFLLRYSMGEIVGYAAYQFMFALFESFTVTLFIGILSILIPARFLRNNLRISGTALVFAFAINAIFFKELFIIVFWATNTFSMSNPAAVQIVIGSWAVSFIFLPISFVMASMNERVKRVINNFIENLSVLVYLYVFLSVIGILLVIIRNVF